MIKKKQVQYCNIVKFKFYRSENVRYFLMVAFNIINDRIHVQIRYLYTYPAPTMCRQAVCDLYTYT